MKRILPALALLLVVTASPAGAQFYDEDQLAKVETVIVGVDDAVRDGCLPQPNALKTEAELILRRSGIKVTEEGNAHFLDISPMGLFVDRRCVASVAIEFWAHEVLADGTSGVVLVYAAGHLTYGRKSGFQQQLREQVNLSVTALANMILKARGK